MVRSDYKINCIRCYNFCTYYLHFDLKFFCSSCKHIPSECLTNDRDKGAASEFFRDVRIALFYCHSFHIFYIFLYLVKKWNLVKSINQRDQHPATSTCEFIVLFFVIWTRPDVSFIITSSLRVLYIFFPSHGCIFLSLEFCITITTC